MRFKFIIPVVFAIFSWEISAKDNALSVLEYLQQVKTNHGMYKAAQDLSEGAKLKTNEGQILLNPTLFGSIENTDDHKPGVLYTYDSVQTKSLNLGVSQTTAIGITGKFYYQLTDTVYHEINLGTETISPDYLQASPVLELTMPLKRNWLGRETKAQIEQIEAGNEQNEYNQSFQMKSILAQASGTYWNLALMRQSVRVAEDSVTRNTKIFSWREKKSRDGLGENADVLQADAALQMSKIMLKNAKDEEKLAARAFNLARGIDASEVEEELMPMTDEYLNKLEPPKRLEMREDVKAVQAQARQTKAIADLGKMKYEPTLEIFTSSALNNENPLNHNSALGTSFTTKHPTNTIGLRFNMPLTYGVISDVTEGLAKDKSAAEYTYQRKILEQENSWKSWNEQFYQSQEKYRMYTILEEKQRKKLENEQERYATGRTTTQQVLQFESDYESAQLSRLQILNEYFTAYAQLKLFE